LTFTDVVERVTGIGHHRAGRLQAVCHDVGLADVATRAADSRFVVAKKHVDAGSLGFLPPEQISQVRSAGRQDMSRPIRDLCVVRPPAVPSTRNNLICLPRTQSSSPKIGTPAR
jgi:hypothetical protein